MRIAVIIPTCDRPHLLQRALASIAAQTRKPDEVVVVNDGAAPLSVKLDPNNLMLLEGNTYCGTSAARNAGAAASGADVLAFLDDDDTWEPSYLMLCEARMVDHRSNLVLTAFNKVRMDGCSTMEKVPPEHMDANDWLVRNQGLRGSNLFIRRTLFEAVGGFDEALPAMNDMDLAIRLAEHPGLRYARQTLPLVNFHVHGGERLSSPGSTTNRSGVETFRQKHGWRMNATQRQGYRDRVMQLWGWDPGLH
jgi:glycosyltransferase involved in cell wall biosynthesis